MSKKKIFEISAKLTTFLALHFVSTYNTTVMFEFLNEMQNKYNIEYRTK